MNFEDMDIFTLKSNMNYINEKIAKLKPKLNQLQLEIHSLELTANQLNRVYNSYYSEEFDRTFNEDSKPDCDGGIIIDPTDKRDREPFIKLTKNDKDKEILNGLIDNLKKRKI